jgi:hypothetical protein
MIRHVTGYEANAFPGIARPTLGEKGLRGRASRRVFFDSHHLARQRRQRQGNAARAGIGVDHAIDRSQARGSGHDVLVGAARHQAIGLSKRTRPQAHARRADGVFDGGGAKEQVLLLAEQGVSARAVDVVDHAQHRRAGGRKLAREVSAWGQLSRPVTSATSTLPSALARKIT